MARLIKYENLTANTKLQVQRQYVHWRFSRVHSSFAQWAHQHAFYVRKDDKLDNRYTHCESTNFSIQTFTEAS